MIPWQRLTAQIEPHYPKAGAGRQPLGLEEMLRIYFLQQWLKLSDPGSLPSGEFPAQRPYKK